ncbi:MAG: TIGR02206 family membrane protein, partial [Chloroflexi bacterium]
SELLYALPLQLCDAAIFICAFALWTRKQLLIEVAYFWGLAGTIQGLITPDLPAHFPSFLFIQYNIAHGGVVAAALFLVVGLNHWPRPRAVVYVFGVTVAYAAFVGFLDAVTGADYLWADGPGISAPRAWWRSYSSSSWTRHSRSFAAHGGPPALVRRARTPRPRGHERHRPAL